MWLVKREKCTAALHKKAYNLHPPFNSLPSIASFSLVHDNYSSTASRPNSQFKK